MECENFCIFPEKVHSTFPRAFVLVGIDHQGLEFTAYRETALFRGLRVAEGLLAEPYAGVCFFSWVIRGWSHRLIS
jgi:hypothetical protein